MTDTLAIPVFAGPTELRWGDLDAYGHVNNVRFFDYFQEARVRWLNQCQVRMDDPLHGFVVVHVSCDFLQELCYPAQLWNTIDVIRCGRSSITLLQCVADFARRDIRYGKGRTTMVWRNHRSGRSTPIPEDLLQRLLRPLQDEPDDTFSSSHLIS